MKQSIIETASKSYPLFIGKKARFQLKNILQRFRPSFSSLFVITDDVVGPLYAPDVIQTLKEVVPIAEFRVEHGEQAKSMRTYELCLEKAFQFRLDRKSGILALGGGVVGDLAGFVAATYMRGIRWIQMPTTLLAHDSSVGGKTGINHSAGKNMIGSFHQPEAIVYDTETLSTLPVAEIRSGFAEVIKHALIGDKDFFQQLQKKFPSANAFQRSDFAEEIEKGIMIKARIVKEDEKETGVRAYLNFGHTLGQALEAELGYGRMLHGDAVALGMWFALRASEAYYGKNMASLPFAKWLLKLGYPLQSFADLDPNQIFDRMKLDKKAEYSQIREVLLKEIAVPETIPLADDFIFDQLQKTIADSRQMR